MKRSIERAREQYQKLADKGIHCDFYMDDIRQIADVAEDENGVNLFYAICIALEVGYAIGYRQSKKGR